MSAGSTSPVHPASTHTRHSISVAQMQRIDDTAIHRLGIPRLLLMDHAGAAVARAAREVLTRAHAAPIVLICCGTGYNGGDGLSAARHLQRWGLQPRVLVLGRLDGLRDEPLVFARMLQALRIPVREIFQDEDFDAAAGWWSEASLIIDALLGLGLQGDVRPLYARAIERINASRRPIVAVDIPSGLDGDTGEPHTVAVKSTVTVTFGRAKHGLVQGQGPDHAGLVLVEDISFPPHLLE